MRWSYKTFGDEQKAIDFLNKYSAHLYDVQIIWRHKEALFTVFYRTSLLSI